MRCGVVMEEGEYCHHFSLVALCFKKQEGKFSLPKSHRQWAKVVGLGALTVRPDPSFDDWKCYGYIPFIILSLSLLKIFHDPDLVLQILLLYLLFLKSFVSCLRSISITCCFSQLLRKKICQRQLDAF